MPCDVDMTAALTMSVVGCAVLCMPAVTSKHKTPAESALSARWLPLQEVDVWAAGVMMYQLMSDRFPFWDTDVHGVARLGPMAIRTGISQGQVLFTSAPWVAPKAATASAQGAADHSTEGAGLQQPAVIAEEAKDLIKRMLTRPVQERISAREALEHPWFMA